MHSIDIEQNSVPNLPVEDNCVVEINGTSNTLKIMNGSNGYVKFHGSNSCIYVGYEQELLRPGHVTTNDLLYQAVEVLELLILLLLYQLLYQLCIKLY